MGMSYRNFIVTEIFSELKKQYDIYYLTFDNSTIADILISAGENVIRIPIELLTNYRYPSLIKWVEKLAYFSFYIKHRPKTISKYIKRDRLRSFKFYFNYIISLVLSSFFPQNEFIMKHYSLKIENNLAKIINKYDLLLFLSTDVIHDKVLQSLAARLRIKFITIVHSWDNLPSRGFLAADPTGLLVWNNTMKKQAIEMHGLSESSIEIIGVPQFHYYMKIQYGISEGYFTEKYQIPGYKKVITYTCSAERVFPDEEIFIEKLVEWVNHNDHYLIIRLHPTERAEYYNNKFSSCNNTFVDLPDGLFAATIVNNLNSSDVAVKDFIALMKYSDVVINLASTTSLDAILFDTPVVCIAFNSDKSLEGSWNEAGKWYDSSHYSEISKSNAVTITNSYPDMVGAINKYLDNPEIDRENRSRLKKKFCGSEVNTPNRIRQAVNKTILYYNQ